MLSGARMLRISAVFAVSSAIQCPPPDFKTQGELEGGFDLKWYTSSKWYTQQQMIISYLPADYLNCVTAEYSLLDSPTLLGYNIKVMNHAENKDGKPLGPLTTICAKVVNETAGKLEVSPCFLPTFLAGPYWVVAFDKEVGWALVSGGAPKNQGTNGCQTGTGTNDSGLWIFTRKPERDDALLQKVRGIAAAKGFDVSVLRDTDESTCRSLQSPLVV